MANVVKIFELRTLGYDKLVGELERVEKEFRNLTLAKSQLNNVKLRTTDADELKTIKSSLNDYSIALSKNRIEAQKYNAQVEAIIKTKKLEILSNKAAIDSNNAEAGSYNDLVNKLKTLQALRKNTAPGSNLIFNGQSLNFDQAKTQASILTSQIGALGKEMGVVGQVGNATNSSLAKGFQNLKGHLGQMIVLYTGWFAAFHEIGNIIQSNIKLSDAFADIQIRIKGSREDVDKLFESLRKIDTRTSLKDLVDISNIIAKKGVPVDRIAALTAEFDRLNVVLGTEIGEPATATASIIKLITIFNDDKEVTAARVKEIGTQLFKLTTTGVATGEFLVNFAERVGAVRGITGLTLPSIFGLGAALQQLGQRVEVSGTAIVQFMTRIFTDVPKFAKAAGLELQNFRDILADDPLKALAAVAKGLVSLTDDEFHQKFEEIVTDFQSVGVEGVRVKAVLGDLATNVDFVKKRMADAAVSTRDLARQTEAANLKQHTFAATLQRVRKEFEQIGTSKAVQLTLAAIGGLILFLVSNLGTIISVLAIYASTWAIANAEMIRARIVLAAQNIAFTFQYAYLVLSTTATKAYTAAMLLFTGATTGATGAVRIFGIALRLLPFGILITLLGFLVAGFFRAKSAINGTSGALRDQAIRQQALNEITEASNKIIGEQIAKIDVWIAVIKKSTTSADVKALAMQKLIELDGRFNKALDGQIILLGELATQYDKVTKSIRLSANAQASATLSAEKNADVLKVTTARQKFEVQGASSVSQKDIKLLVKEGGLSAEVEFALQAEILTDSEAKLVTEAFKRVEARRQEVYVQYLNLQGQNATALAANEEQVQVEKRVALEKKAETDKLNQAELQDLIDGIERQLKPLAEGDALISVLLAKKKAFEERLAKLKGTDKPDKTKPFRGSRVGGEEKDELSRIEAELRLALAAEEARFVALQISTVNGVKQIHLASYDEEREYAKNIKDINEKFNDQKIKYLESQKPLNAKELEVLAGLKKDQYDIQLKYLKDVQLIDNREFDNRRNKLKNQLAEDIDNAQSVQRIVERDPLTSETQRTQAKIDADQKILDLQIQFNADIDKLEKQYNQTTTTNAKEGTEAVRKLKEKLVDDIEDLQKAERIDQDNILARDLAKIDSDYARLRAKILTNDKLTVTGRANALEKLDKLYNFTILSRELERLTLEFKRVKKLYDEGLATEREYLRAKADMEKKANDVRDAGKNLKKGTLDLPSSSNTQKSVQEQISKLFNFEKDSEEFALLGEVISQSFNFAAEAMNNYFDAEEARIRDSLEINLQRLDLEKEQVKARAGSQAEIDSIEKQYAAKKTKAQRDAGEEFKKLKRSEAKIALATELANIAVSAAQNPLNGVTFGASGVIMYALLSALAFGRYALNVSAINREKFEQGGWVKRGGHIRGNKHEHGGVPFNYEAEDGELAIVRTKGAQPLSRYNISGTQTEIASMLNKLGGGTHFKPGARMFASGGFLGSNYQAPSFTPSSNGSDTMEQLAIDMRNMAIATNKRIDRLEVHQVTDTVTDAQRKKVKQNDIGVL